MILGLGSDLVNIERIAKTIARFGNRFLERTFTLNERKEISAQKGADEAAAKAAKFFAAKEAAVKALGSGFREGIRWQDVEVGHDLLGKPLLTMSSKAADKVQALSNGNLPRIYVSLSDDYPVAIAVVIIEN